jgi:CIC family chloride channel protein
VTKPQLRHRVSLSLIGEAGVVGLFAGMISVAFQHALRAGTQFRFDLLTNHTLGHFSLPAIILFCAVTAMLAVFPIVYFYPEARGSGIPVLKLWLVGKETRPTYGLLVTKFIACSIGLAGGLVLGQEGPSVQMGAIIAWLLAKRLKLNARRSRLLVESGAGAGLAAAFNAPLSGVLFIMEELEGEIRPSVVAAALGGAAVADFMRRTALGAETFYAAPAVADPPPLTLPLFVLVGVAAGVFGTLYNSSLYELTERIGRLSSRSRMIYALIVGVSIGCVASVWPEATGGGHVITGHILRENYLARTAVEMLILRFVLHLMCYSSGAPGGIFSPLLSFGSLLGVMVATAIHSFLGTSSSLTTPIVLAGMAATFSAIVQAPITGCVLIQEMTGAYALGLPLLVATLSGSATAQWLGQAPIYERLMRLGGRTVPEPHHAPDIDPLPAVQTITPQADAAHVDVPHSLLPPPGVTSDGLTSGEPDSAADPESAPDPDR